METTAGPEIRKLGKRCCGCEACANACPSGMIQMAEDDEGFRYPVVDDAACQGCGICALVCPLLHRSSGWSERCKPVVYAAYAMDQAIRRLSSSGGIFSVIAQNVLDGRGAVAGAVFAGSEVRHSMIEDVGGLEAMRGSKYLQSRMGGIYSQVRDCLKQNRRILFTGTPCQIDGLYGFLGGDDRNLITCDLACHGVPSGKVFALYLAELERRYGAAISTLAFRNKARGWKSFSVLAEFTNNRTYRRVFSRDPFMYGFINNLYLRPSCHECQYASMPRVGDITLGDFWGIKPLGEMTDDDKGISLVLVNSDKGERLFSSCSDRLKFQPAPLELAISGNPVLVDPVKPSPKRAEFFAELDTKSFYHIERKYLRRRRSLVRFLRKLIYR